MSTECSDCGCRVYDGACTNCHEEIYIEAQYHELDMLMPKEDTEFMLKLRKCDQEMAAKI